MTRLAILAACLLSACAGDYDRPTRRAIAADYRRMADVAQSHLGQTPRQAGLYEVCQDDTMRGLMEAQLRDTPINKWTVWELRNMERDFEGKPLLPEPR